MQLTEEKLEVVLKKLDEDSKGGITCPVCGTKLWAVNKTIMELREFNNGDLSVGANTSVMPLITLTCSECSNTMFFNAIMLGVVDKDNE